MQRKITHSLNIISTSLALYDRIALACSYGKDSIVVMHLCQRIDPKILTFCVMTPFWFEETYSYKHKIDQAYKLNIRDYGDRLPSIHTSPDHNQPEECCDKYKVEPTRQAVKDLALQAWITGLRSTEGTHHRKFTKETEERDGLVKINPILHWTEADIWLYHAAHSIPIHPLYLQGFRSLGCKPCSEPYTEEERGGRWQGTDKCGGECGIHTKSLVQDMADDHFAKDEVGKIKQDVYGMPKRSVNNR